MKNKVKQPFLLTSILEKTLYKIKRKIILGGIMVEVSLSICSNGGENEVTGVDVSDYQILLGGVV